MALYSALVQDKVDFSTGKAVWKPSQKQISYVKQLLFIFGTIGEVRDKLRTLLRDFKLDEAAQVHKANNPDMLWKTVDEEVAEKCGVRRSRVTSARSTMRKIYKKSPCPPQYRSGEVTIDELSLSPVEFEKIAYLFPELQK